MVSLQLLKTKKSSSCGHSSTPRHTYHDCFDQVPADDQPTSQSTFSSSRRPHEDSGANISISPTMISLIILVYAIAVVASSGLPVPAAITTTSPNSPPASLLDQSGTNSTNAASLIIRQNEMEVGSTCHGAEGEWNCMATTFQRCASGQWSVVLDTAYGTVCEPEGLTYDFQPAFASWYPSADTTQTIVCTATATATGDSTNATNTGSSFAPTTGEAASQSAIWAMLLGLASTALLFLAT